MDPAEVGALEVLAGLNSAGQFAGVIRLIGQVKPAVVGLIERGIGAALLCASQVIRAKRRDNFGGFFLSGQPTSKKARA